MQLEAGNPVGMGSAAQAGEGEGGAQATRMNHDVAEGPEASVGLGRVG